MIEEKEGVQELATDFVKGLYAKDDDVTPHELIVLMPRLVIKDINTELTKLFIADEISDALFQIGPLKAPGPDGFLARFFQRNQAILRADVVNVVLHFFDIVLMIEGINDMVILLISKVIILRR